MLTTKNTIILVIISALVFAYLGFAGARMFQFPSQIEKLFSQRNTFQTGWNAAEDRLNENKFFPLMNEEIEVRSINGRVKEVGDNQVDLEIYLFDPLADSELDNRIVEVDENTKIYQAIAKDAAQYQEEAERLKEEIEMEIAASGSFPNSVVPIEPYIKAEINLADIKTGQSIMAIAEGNIRNEKQFLAKEIVIQPESMQWTY